MSHRFWACAHLTGNIADYVFQVLVTHAVSGMYYYVPNMTTVSSVLRTNIYVIYSLGCISIGPARKVRLALNVLNINRVLYPPWLWISWKNDLLKMLDCFWRLHMQILWEQNKMFRYNHWAPDIGIIFTVFMYVYVSTYACDVVAACWWVIFIFCEDLSNFWHLNGAICYVIFILAW